MTKNEPKPTIFSERLILQQNPFKPGDRIVWNEHREILEEFVRDSQKIGLKRWWDLWQDWLKDYRTEYGPDPYEVVSVDGIYICFRYFKDGKECFEDFTFGAFVSADHP